jgi:hypothetical protein
MWKPTALFAALLAVTLAWAGPAPAQSPPAPPAPSASPARPAPAAPEALAAARELIVTLKAADNFKALMPALMSSLKPAIVQNRPQVERDYDALVPVLLEGMNARLGEVLDAIAGIYARNFTAAELNEIVAFYRGPTGQKFVARQTGIMQESMIAGQKFGQAVGAEMQNRMIEELRKKGHNI